ncbi:MAG: glutamate--tRNA ligase [Epsilonproteobacteria bacterium]|nr:glutamate--tRNA ligase [Campylobacterota bacterium]
MSTKMSAVRVRFAPSPTGFLHIGGLRTAIFNWLYARHHGGQFLLRIEDTDLERSKDEFKDAQLAALEWMGFSSDEPLVYQRARQRDHLQAVRALLASGRAYPCFCQPEKADEVVSRLEHGVGKKYDRTCRGKPFSDDDLQKPHAIRFALPEDATTVTFTDKVLGDITTEFDQLDDFVIVRRDGSPVYNLCVVLDDVFMRITHVIRGQDHVSNTPKQVLLYQALGFQVPQFAHIPLILGADGSKLSKRHAAVSVDHYREKGYLPDALCNYLVRLGWAHGDREVFSREELIQLFSLEHVGKSGAVFDGAKLDWLNGLYMRELSAAQLIKCIAVLNPEYHQALQQAWPKNLDQLIDLYKARATTLCDLYKQVYLFSQDPQSLDTGLAGKWLTPNTQKLLGDFVKDLATVPVGDLEAIKTLAARLCQQHDVKLVALAQPLRLALTGGTASPGVFEMIALLGFDRAQVRIQKLVQKLTQ